MYVYSESGCDDLRRSRAWGRVNGLTDPDDVIALLEQSYADWAELGLQSGTVKNPNPWPLTAKWIEEVVIPGPQ